MESDIRNRIEKLKQERGYKTDSQVIEAIYEYKKSRGEIGKTHRHTYLDNNKGSFSQAFNGKRKFNPKDYLAIESVLNASMIYIIEGKGDIPDSFKPSGIRYAAYTDTIGNYEELMREDILNGSDEYNKMLIDYMVEYKSKNGFIYFAERDMLPINSTGGRKYDPKCINYYRHDNTELLKILCELLPVNLLIRYFDGFLRNREIQYIKFDNNQNTSFTEDVISEAIKRDDLRAELTKTKVIDLDNFNNQIIRMNNKSLGKGMFVNYGLTLMVKYSLHHDVDDSIREELLENSIRLNDESLRFASSFEEDELKIDKFGYLTDRYESICYGSIVVPSEPSIELSDKSKELLEELNRQVHDYHELICHHSQISAYGNEILADKKDNTVYYDFFGLMNNKGIKTVPLYKKETSKDKDLFEVSNSEESIIANGTIETLQEIMKAIKEIDEASWSKLNGKTYYLVDPSIYMLGGKVNYIMPKNIIVSEKYSNVIRLLNENAMWQLFEPNNKVKIKRFIYLLKLCEIKKEELNEFLNQFISISEENAKSTDKSNDRGKELAFKTLENKSWIEIYSDEIIKNF